MEGKFPDGELQKSDGSSKFLWPCVVIENYRLVQCLSNRHNEFCQNGAMSMSFEQMKQMVIEEANLDGIYIHNGINSWLVILKEYFVE